MLLLCLFWNVYYLLETVYKMKNSNYAFMYSILIRKCSKFSSENGRKIKRRRNVDGIWNISLAETMACCFYLLDVFGKEATISMKYIFHFYLENWLVYEMMFCFSNEICLYFFDVTFSVLSKLICLNQHNMRQQSYNYNV